MCCREAFWKRVVVFCLTFGLGVLVSGLFIPEQLPQSVKPTVIAAPPEYKNCVPVDESLKYERLTAEEKNVAAVAEKDLKPEAEKPADKRKPLKNEKDNEKKSTERQLYDPSRDSAEYKKLLHKQRCFEPQAQ